MAAAGAGADAKAAFPSKSAVVGSAESLPFKSLFDEKANKVLIDCWEFVGEGSSAPDEASRAVREYLLKVLPHYTTCPVEGCVSKPGTQTFYLFKGRDAHTCGVVQDMKQWPKVTDEHPVVINHFWMDDMYPLRCDKGHVYWPATGLPCDVKWWDARYASPKKTRPAVQDFMRYHCFGKYETEALLIGVSIAMRYIIRGARAEALKAAKLSAKLESKESVLTSDVRSVLCRAKLKLALENFEGETDDEDDEHQTLPPQEHGIRQRAAK